MSSTQMTSTTLNHSRGSTEASQFSDKYHGMIKQSAYKKFRNIMFILFGYVYSTAPNFYPLHSFMSFYRILQFLGPVTAAPFGSLWVNSDSKIAPQLSSFLSILIHLLPVNIREKGYIPFLIVFIVYQIFLLLMLIVSAFLYKKNAQLPFAVPIILVALISSFCYILPPIYAEYAGEMIGHMISGTVNFGLVFGIFAILVSTILFGIYFWLFGVVITVASTFRPNSLLSVTNTPQMLMFATTMLVNFLSAVASKSTPIVCYVFLVLTALVYFGGITSLFLDGGYVHTLHSIPIAAASITGGIMMLIYLILLVLNQSSSEIILFCIILLFIFAYFGSRAIMNRSIVKYLSILDAVMESNECFEMMKSPFHFMNVLTIGMSCAHPTCINWNVCRLACEKWPKNIKIWYFFAKFVAIYPEETQQLLIIQQNIVQNKLKGAYAKQTLEQIQTVIRLRESNLSPTLKDKLNNVVKQMQTTKHKMRHVWDMIIQGNISELEAAIQSTYNAIVKCNAQYNHILGQYPNNRFVTRSYSRFLLDVMADLHMFEKYDNDTKLLQRGLNASEDQAHMLGLHEFVNMPTVLRDKLGQMFSGTTADEMSTIDTIIETDGVVVEQAATISQQISDIKIPSISLLRIARPFIIIVVCICPLIAILIYAHILVDRESIPLEHIYRVSSLRSSLFLLSTFSMQYGFEKLGCISNVMESSQPPEFLGSTEDIGKQLAFVIKEAASTINDIKELRDFKLEDEYMNEVRVILFTNKLLYKTYPDNKNNSYMMIKPTTTFGACVDYILMATELVQEKDITLTTLGQQFIQNPVQNLDLVSTQMSDSLTLLVNFMVDEQKNINLVIHIILITGSIVIAFLVILSSFLILRKANHDKLEIYKCLTTLPKNVVSNVADRLKILKKNQQGGDSSYANTDIDMNKQEENMMKIFASAGGGSGSRTKFQILNMTITFIQMILGIAALCMIGLSTKSIIGMFCDAAPHVNFFLGAFSYALGIVNFVYQISSQSNTCKIPNTDFNIAKLAINELMKISVGYFNIVRYGDDTYNSFSQFRQVTHSATLTKKCNDSEFTMESIYACMDPEFRYHYYEALALELIVPFYLYTTLYDLEDEKILNMWNLVTIYLYNDYFAPIFTEITNDVKDSVARNLVPLIAVGVSLAVVILLLELIALLINMDYEKKLRFTLRLFLHCPPNVILQNSRITSLLSSNFSKHSHEKTLRNSEYFKEILSNLPDAILMIGENHTISEINKSGVRLFGFEKRLEDMTIGDLFDSSKNVELAKFFTSDAIQNNTVEKENILFVRGDGSKFHLQMTTAKIKNELIVTARDVTQTVRYNTLISEERAKSDMLLASILPPKLVHRVRSGEKDISFAVQSASITFIDIVEFTPWCASLQAAEVMTTLNRLFTYFDNCVAKYPTMTRVKCIGDCYMAAGGIFSEVNQPEVHAKDIVEFGLDAIDSVVRLNNDLSQTLKIRVGINTGGPIVAGVLGVGKPTFEIIGPAINLAQQMEHHGVPMSVHISRSVYELIYGGSFEIKERGEVEIKNGSVLTYLVLSRKT